MEKNEPNDNNDIATCHSNHNPESYTFNDNFNQALFFYTFLGRAKGDWKNSSVMLWEENGRGGSMDLKARTGPFFKIFLRLF